MKKELRRKSKGIEPLEDRTVFRTQEEEQEEAPAAVQAKGKKRHRLLWTILAVICVLVCTVGVFCAVTGNWAFETWPNLGIEEMLFQLSNNVKGTGGGILKSFIMKCALPSVIVLAGLSVLMVVIRRHHKALRNVCVLALCAGLVLCISTVRTFYVKADVKGYLEAQNADSSFIEQNYADPSATQITFPETKRNLIYIFLESMEMTYADEANGGGFAYNCIPELTQLAEENECFAGNTGKLNGAHAYENAHYTSAAMFAQTSGLPLQLNENIYTLNNHDVYYPGIATIGSILKNEGYTNTLLIGSDGDFGNRASYFENHGSYEIRDYYYAQEHGWIPEGYRVWWGYEDAKLFDNAKTTLNELSSSSQPFNLTMLTVDTHFEDGYFCQNCQNEFDTQYANVMACSSRQVKAFVDWCRTQPWYDNTTIVINGDHKTMDSDFCNDVDSSYDRRTYTCYINAAAQPADPDKERVYSTQDNFPTTLAALGCSIQGDRLGLGTNLFSSTETLSEQYGTDRINQEMRNKSDWLVNQSNVSSSYGVTVSYIPRDDGGLSVYASDITNLMNSVDYIQMTCDSEAGHFVRNMMKTEDASGSLGDETYAAKLSSQECSEGDSFHIRMDAVFSDGSTSLLYERQYSPELMHIDVFSTYMNLLRYKDCDILLAYKAGSTGLDQSALKKLQDFGFEQVPNSTEASYVGALTDEGVQESVPETAGDKVDQSGSLSSGHSYELISAAGENTDIAGISIDGQNCSPDGTGLNIVAVDRKTGYVLDAAYYDPESGVLTHQ